MRPAKSGLGWHVYTPLEMAPAQHRAGSTAASCPTRCKDPQSRRGGPGWRARSRCTGLVRRRRRHGRSFTPANDAARNLWYWPDAAAMTASAFAAQPVEAAPVLDRRRCRAGPPGGLPRGGVTRLDLPNRHLEYALTWYGLALTLIGVYAAFAGGRLRDPRAA